MNKPSGTVVYKFAYYCEIIFYVNVSVSDNEQPSEQAYD